LDIVLNRFVRDTFVCEDHGINQSATQTAAERESLRPECRADTARLERLLAPDFHELYKRWPTCDRAAKYLGGVTSSADSTRGLVGFAVQNDAPDSWLPSFSRIGL